MSDEKSEKIEVASETGEIIMTAAPAEKRNRIRDIGLYLAVAVVSGAMFLGFIDMANTKAALNEFRAEVDAMRKAQVETSGFKDELAKQTGMTRSMVFQAWQGNKDWHKAADDRMEILVKEVRALRTMVTKLEKTISAKEGADAQPYRDDHSELLGSCVQDTRCRHRR